MASHIVKEPARLREVHKYYQRPADIPDSLQPTRTSVGATPIATPDTALTAFLQLITWRLSKQRAIVSLVDKDHQFFIAESTKTGSLVDPSSYEEAGDEQWMGCTGSTTRGEALCTNTIVAEEVPGGYPSFVVTDLPNEPRFADLPYVKGPPYFRFYAGTPLISKAGFRIGSLFVIDDRVHAPLTEDELDFLGVMATNVMKYLELQTESREQKRHMTMSKGLAALVEGRGRIPDHWNNSKPNETGTSRSHAREIDLSMSPGSSKGPPMPEVELDLSNPVQEDNSMLYKKVFARASNLLRESLDCDYSVFIDTSKHHGLDTGARAKANVVGYSSHEQSTLSGEDVTFSGEMEQGFLSTLCRSYHDGKIWSYNEDGSFDYDIDTPMSLSSDDGSSSPISRSSSKRSKKESEKLLKCFPGARQILFAPLWDSATGFSSPEYFSACFAVSNREVPVFTTEIEVAFVRAFVNSVGVICGHLAAALGEKQKSMFISSMSHELRSPLHGILASTELLYGTPLSMTQTDLCDTVEVCGQTLLDTLSQILDYSKVNNFLRDTHNSGDSDPRSSLSKTPTTNGSTSGLLAGSSLHTYSECDVASLCEEALDVVSMSFRQTSAYGSPTITPLTEFGSLAASHKSADDSVVVDFTAPNEDWVFLCSPGAIRRIVMNLVGNSYKYCERGSISVNMSLRIDDEQPHGESTVVISVIDTGRGMSEDFMRKKLFVPFTQESSVTPGSGLGLSLVQGIVKSLNGKIEVKSEVGKGTNMEVSLPLKRSSRHKSTSRGQLTPASVSWLEEKTFNFYGPETLMHQRLKDSIRYYMKSWWNVREVSTFEPADIVFLDALDAPRLKESRQLGQHSYYGVVLSRVTSLRDVRSMDNQVFRSLEPLRVPFGPKKLLKALQASAKRSSDMHIPSVRIEDASGEAEDAQVEHMKMLPPPRPRLDPENRRSTAVPSTGYLPIREHTLPRQNSQPIPQIKNGPAVLCVDDNAINLKLLITFAKKLGFENVQSVENGMLAFQAADKFDRGFDVIFMDLTMPVMDGFESTRRIRKLEAQRKCDGKQIRPSIIVALTGLASDEDQKKAFAAGVDHFVTKPLRFKDLKQMLSDWNIDGSAKVDDKEIPPG